MVFGFDDRIYWTSIQLYTTLHKSLSDTMSWSSDWTLHENYCDFQMNWTAPNRTELNYSVVLLCTPSILILIDFVLYYFFSLEAEPQETHSLPSNGYMCIHTENTSCNIGSSVACLYCGCCLEMDLLYCWLCICCGVIYWVVPYQWVCMSQH
jgi:hypothetical protein